MAESSALVFARARAITRLSPVHLPCSRLALPCPTHAPCACLCRPCALRMSAAHTPCACLCRACLCMPVPPMCLLTHVWPLHLSAPILAHVPPRTCLSSCASVRMSGSSASSRMSMAHVPPRACVGSCTSSRMSWPMHLLAHVLAHTAPRAFLGPCTMSGLCASSRMPLPCPRQCLSQLPMPTRMPSRCHAPILRADLCQAACQHSST